MDVAPLGLGGALVLTPRQFPDDRGVFLEWFRADALHAATGHDFDLAQANCSVSSKGTLRGVHYADVPPGQAKYVTCIAGAAWDVVVDLEVGSETFGQWRAVHLDAVSRRAVYLPEGLGHAFLALEDATAVVYLCNQFYNPGGEHGVHPLDPELAIAWPLEQLGGEPTLSPKDESAPTLAEARAAGRLPLLDTVATLIRSRPSAPGALGG